MQKELNDQQEKRKEKIKKGLQLKQNQTLFFETFKMFPGKNSERLEKSNSEPLNFFSCNIIWPICVYNFARNHVKVEEFVFKTQNFDDRSQITEYFDEKKFEERMNAKPATTETAHLLTERSYHYCKANLFTDILASLFVSTNPVS